MPILKINEWLEKETQLGSPNPSNIVLSTVTSDHEPHSRIVAIREISPEGIIFFTQRYSRKFNELIENPNVSMTLWLPLQQREVIIEGSAKSLKEEENEKYWQALPRERQLRFTVYAKTSAQPISSLSELEKKYEEFSEIFSDSPIPISEHYCGFRVNPHTFYFYTLGGQTFSEYIKYFLEEGEWREQLLSP